MKGYQHALVGIVRTVVAIISLQHVASQHLLLTLGKLACRKTNVPHNSSRHLANFYLL